MEKIECFNCEYCAGANPRNNKRMKFYCKHPNQEYINNYAKEQRMVGMAGFIGFSKGYPHQVPIKTAPTWCPKKINRIQKGAVPSSENEKK